MNPTLLLLAMASTLTIAACKPEAPAEPAAPATPVEQTAEPAPVAVESAPAVTPADVPFDTKGFAGTFSGADMKLSLNADGTFKLEEGQSGNGFDGTWTAEEGGKRIRLDPNSKSEEDRLYAIASNDQLDALGADGQASTGASLKREGAAQ